MMMATLLPAAPAGATADVSGRANAAVDIDGRWGVVSNSPDETVWLMRYDEPTSSWVEVEPITPAAAGDNFGLSVAIDASLDVDNPVIVVGSPSSNNVEIYQYVNGVGVTSIATLPGPPTSFDFGSSVALVADVLAVGAPGTNGGQGAAYQYMVDPAAPDFTNFFELTEPDADPDANTGAVVKIARGDILAGAPGQGDNEEGAIFVFDITTGTLDSTLKSDNPVNNGRFGSTIDADSSRVIIGGAVDAVVLQGNLQLPVVTPNPDTLFDVAISGNLVAIYSDGFASILSDNGGTGNFVPVQTVGAGGDFGQIALGGGQLFVANPFPAGAATLQNILATAAITPAAIPGKILPEVGRQRGNLGDRVAAEGNTMVSTRGTGSLDGDIIVFKDDGGAWAESQRLITPNNEGATSVALNGDTMAVLLADRGDGTRGHVAIYQRVADGPFSLTTSFRTASDTNARSLAINDAGDQLALGLPTVGVVELYRGGPAAWGVAAETINPIDSRALGSQTFGHDVDFDGSLLFVGKPETASLTSPSANAGSVEAFSDTGTIYVEQSTIIPASSAPGDAAGWAIEAQDGDRAIASPGLGQVLLLRTLQPDRLFVDDDANTTDQWGFAMAMNQGVLAISDWFGETDVYDVASDSITSLAEFTSPDLEQSDFAASSFPLAASDGNIFVGARLEDAQESDSGAIYTFAVTLPDPPPAPRVWPAVVAIDGQWAAVGNPAQDLVHVLFNDGSGWIEAEQLTGLADSAFGAAVAMEGPRLFVGAPNTGSNVGAISGYLRNESGLYELDATWAGDSADDTFGSVIDVDGNWVIAGAPTEVGLARTLINDVDLLNPVTLVRGAPSDGFGTAVATSTTVDKDGNVLELAWAGAPGADAGAGQVRGFRYDGTAWIATETAFGDTAGDRYGTSIEANGRVLAATAPQATPDLGYIRTFLWDANGIAGPGTTRTATSPLGGDIVFNGNQLAAGAVSSSEIHIWSNNGQLGSIDLVAIYASAATGRSIDLDGLWLIGATNAESTDWTDLANLVRITDIGTIPNQPANKTVIELGSDDEAFGTAVAMNEDVWVASTVSGATKDGGVVRVYDRASNTLIQTIDPGSVNGFGRSVALDGDRLAIGAANQVTLYRRAPGQPFTQSQVLTNDNDFGASIAFDGDLLVVGAPGADGNGRVHVYADDLTVVAELAESPITADFSDGDYLGASVAINGNVIIAGAPKSYPGSAAFPEFGYLTVFTRPDEATPFAETSQLLGTEGVLDQFDGLGTSLTFDGTRLAAGAPLEDRNAVGDASNPGVIYVWDHTGGGNFTGPVLLDPQGQFAVGTEVQAKWGTSVALSDNNLIVGGPGFGGTATDQGAVGHYLFDADTWTPTSFTAGDVVTPDADPADRFGASIAISGFDVVVGAPGESVAGYRAGAVYNLTVAAPVIPEPDNKLLSEPGIDLTDAEVGDLFGFAMDTDGARLVIGAPEWIELPVPLGDLGIGGTGGVFVFSRIGDGWSFEQFIDNPDVDAVQSRFGEAVAIDGDLVAIGASSSQFRDEGRAFVYNLATNSSVEVTPGDLGVSSQYGGAIDIQNGTLIVGASGYDFDAGGNVNSNAGKVYIWNEDGAGGYLLTQEVFGENAGSAFGRRLSFDGGALAIGMLDNTNIGTVDVLRRSGGFFIFEQRLAGTEAGAQFGFAVDLDGDRLIVGEPNAERAFLFTYDNGVWDGGQQLVPNPGIEPGDEFGFAVAIDGTVAVVGERADSNGFSEDGRLHTFGITTARTWDPLETFVAPDPATNDQLGWSVEVTGGSVIGGAPFDTNNNGLNAGAAYLFAVTPPPEPPPIFDPASITISYELPESVQPGATTVTIEGAQVASIEGAEGSGAAAGVVATSLGTIDLDEPPTGSSATTSPLGDVTLGELGLDALGLDALYDIPLTEFPIDGGWGPVLAGTAFDGYPLQTVTLGDVYGFASVQSIPLRFTEIQDSPLRFTDIAAVALGSIPITQIDLDGDPATDPYTEWCDAIALQAASCAGLGIEPGSSATLGSIAAAGVNLEATPLRFTPLRFTYVEASPLRFTPLRFTDIEASPLRFTPLRFTPLRFTPLRFTPLRFTPLRFTPLRFTPLRFTPLRFTDINATPLRFTPLRFTDNPSAIADCGAINCDSATIGDAFNAGALLDFQLNDLGDAVLTDLRFDNILAGLDEASVAALQSILADDSITLESLLDQFGIEGIGELTLGDIDPDAFETIAELLSFTVGEFLESLDPEVLETYSLADFLLLFIPRTAYEWDEVDLATISIQSAGLQAPITASVAFMTTGGEPTNNVTLQLSLPDSAVAQSSSFRLAPTGASITSTSVNGQNVEIQVTNVAPDVEQTLTFGLLQGLTLGTSSSFVSAEVDGVSDNATDTVTVTEAFEPENGALAGSVPVLANNLYLSHIGQPGDVDFYRITVTEPNTSVSLRLGNLAADLDMVVYGPQLGSIIPTTGGEVASAPDAEFGSGSGGTLSPVPLNDLPASLAELQAYGASYFRGTQAEQIDFLAIEAGDYFVQIAGYLGASSPEPYSLRAAVTPTEELPCPAREFSFTGGPAGTSSTVSSSANAIVLMNRSRLELVYGPDDAAAVVAAAEAMVSFANASGAVSADILDVDALAGTSSAYDAWDANPCSVLSVNGVVSSIADAILGIRANQDIDHVLVIGGDDIIPFGRVKDGTTIANEQSYTNTFTSGNNNALRTAFSESFVLTDDPYADSAPAAIANTDRVVYVPEVAMGRLVENPAEITSALNNFVLFGGLLDPQTGFVAGYDFLDDGAEETADRLDEVVSPGSVQRLINETWGANELEAGLAAQPDTALVSAHFDHANALPASGNLSGDTTDLFSVTDAEEIDYDGAILFSVGCHSGLSVSDVLIAPTGVVSQDWAQTFLGNGAAAYVGNTGYGYGDDTAVALSERIMTDFADGLDEYATVGEALLYAKQDYSANLTVYGAFDEKALMEATFYGIPFYRLSNTIVPEEVPDPPTAPVETGGQGFTESFDPVIEVTGDGTEDEVWSTPGDDGEDQIQVTNGYPILPRFEWEVTQQDPGNPDVLELEARGVVLESLVTRDEINVDPATARAVYDLAANEPNIDAAEVTFALSPAINTYLSPEGIRQNVNMTVGAFETTGAGGVGTMRLFEEFDATVYYAQDPDGDSTKPVISEVQSNPAGGTFNLSVRVQDESEIVRTLALVTPMPAPNVATTWQLLELTRASNGRWEGAADLNSPTIQWLVMSVDANGNSAWSMSKDLAFDGLAQTDFAPTAANLQVSGSLNIGDPIDFSVDVTDFDGSDDALSLSWDFGDGNSCTAGSGGSCELVQPTDAAPRGSSTASHVYDTAGTYEVTVRVTDSSGLMDTIVTTIDIQDPAPGTGEVAALGFFRTGGLGSEPDDILPSRSRNRWAWFYLDASSSAADPDPTGQFRFFVRGINLRGIDITEIDVLSDSEAVVEGTARSGRWWNRQYWTYRVEANESTGRVRLEVWPQGTDPETTEPTYRTTTRFLFNWQVDVEPG